jgi:hypothetical protein
MLAYACADSFARTKRAQWYIEVDSEARRWSLRCHHRSADELLSRIIHVLEDISLEVEGFEWKSAALQHSPEPNETAHGMLQVFGGYQIHKQRAGVERMLRLALYRTDSFDDVLLDDYFAGEDDDDRSASGVQVRDDTAWVHFIDQWRRRGECVVTVRSAACTATALEQIIEYLGQEGFVVRSAEIIAGGYNRRVVTPETPSCPCAECLVQAQQLWAAAQADALNARVPLTLLLGLTGSASHIAHLIGVRLDRLRALCTKLAGPECSVEVYPPHTAVVVAALEDGPGVGRGISLYIPRVSDLESFSEYDDTRSIRTQRMTPYGVEHPCRRSSDGSGTETTCLSASPPRYCLATTGANGSFSQTAVKVQHCDLGHASEASVLSMAGHEACNEQTAQRTGPVRSDSEAELVTKRRQTSARMRMPDEPVARIPVEKVPVLKTDAVGAGRDISLVSDDTLQESDTTRSSSEEQEVMRGAELAGVSFRSPSAFASSAWSPSETRTPDTITAAEASAALRAPPPGIAAVSNSEIAGTTLNQEHLADALRYLFAPDIPRVSVEHETSTQFRVVVHTHSRPGVGLDLIRAFRALRCTIVRGRLSGPRDTRPPLKRLGASSATDTPQAVVAELLLQVPALASADMLDTKGGSSGTADSGIERWKARLRNIVFDAVANPICMRNARDGAVTCVALHAYAHTCQLGDLLRFMHAARMRVRRARMRTFGTRIYECVQFTDMVMQKAVPSMLWADLRARMLAALFHTDCTGLVFPARTKSIHSRSFPAN